MKLLNENLAELSNAEAEAFRDAQDKHHAIVRDYTHRETSAAVRNAAGTFDIANGIKLAGLLHEGKLHAAVCAGAVTEIVGRIVEQGAAVINDGDIQRGRSLALRNFEHDPELITDEIDRVPSLNKIVNAYIEIKNGGSNVVPEAVSAGTAQSMTDDDLNVWRLMAIDSLCAIEVELAKRGVPLGATEDAAIDRAFGAGARAFGASVQQVSNEAYRTAVDSLAAVKKTRINPVTLRKPRKTAAKRRRK